MDDSGWKFIQANNLSFIVRRCFSTTNFKLLLSDHKRLWSAEGTANVLLQLSRKENPLWEFDHSKVTKNIFNLFDKSLNALSVNGSNETTKYLKMSSSFDNRPFNLVWTLIEQGPDSLFKEVTGPLLHSLSVVNRRQEYLCREIILKDKEINEHVLENGNLMWGRIKTEKFNKEEFSNEFLFSSYDDPDPVKTAWEETGVQDILNKVILQSKKYDHGEGAGPTVKEVNVKLEKMVPETVHEVDHEVIGSQVKEEKVAEESQAKSTQTKRKKLKLNL